VFEIWGVNGAKDKPIEMGIKGKLGFNATNEGQAGTGFEKERDIFYFTGAEE